MAKLKESQGFMPVLAAVVGNTGIMVLKFIAFLTTGSSALFSEAVHSLADVSNQVLLMIGIRRSIKPSNDEFGYGYGRERFFWALISACSIFFLGAGITISHGIQQLYHHETPTISSFVFIVLAVSFVIESITLGLAVIELHKNHKNEKWRHIWAHGDPTTVAVVLEDSVAVVGVLIALASTIMTRATGDWRFDAIGSIMIGAMLGVVALILINKNRTFLIGRAMPHHLETAVMDILLSDPTIEKVLEFKSTTLDINKYRIKCEVEFNSTVLLRNKFHQSWRDEYDEVRDDYEEFIKFTMDLADRIPRLIGQKIDELEKRIHRNVPCVKYIDIEIN